jgi:hypothetical protein
MLVNKEMRVDKHTCGLTIGGRSVSMLVGCLPVLVGVCGGVWCVGVSPVTALVTTGIFHGVRVLETGQCDDFGWRLIALFFPTFNTTDKRALGRG